MLKSLTFQKDCFNLLWRDLDKIVEVIKSKGVNTENEADGGEPPAKRMKTIERYQWEIKKKGTIVRKSKAVFLTMRECMAEAGALKLNSGEILGYSCNNFDFADNSDIIKKVYTYLYKQDYEVICFFKCLACQKESVVHNEFCLKATKFVFNELIGTSCQERISPMRLTIAVNKIRENYGVYEYLSIGDIHEFLDKAPTLNFSGIHEMIFEAELQILDIQNIGE